MQNEILKLLVKHNLRRTNIRKQVLQLFLNAKTKALASSDLEKALDNPDRITLYRTLRTFEKRGLIHQAVDGSGTMKYALCSETCTEKEHHDEHAHFHCYECGNTICLEEKVKPNINLPAGFEVKQAHLVLEGKCQNCATLN